MRNGLLFSSLLFVLFLSCDLLVNNTGNRTDLHPIDSTVHIDMQEVLDPVSPSLKFLLRTERIYPCYNYTIENDVTKHRNIITVGLHGIYKPDLCLTALGPARAYIDPGRLDNGAYRLHFDVQGKGVEGKLVKSDEVFTMSFPETGLISLEREVLRRIPEYTIWGLVRYFREPSLHLAESFVDSLEQAGAVKTTLTPGDYRYFTITEENEIVYPGGFGNPYNKLFIYRYRHSVDRIRDLVAHFGKEYADSLTVTVHTWQGDSFKSWVLANE